MNSWSDEDEDEEDEIVEWAASPYYTAEDRAILASLADHDESPEPTSIINSSEGMPQSQSALANIEKKESSVSFTEFLRWRESQSSSSSPSSSTTSLHLRRKADLHSSPTLPPRKPPAQVRARDANTDAFATVSSQLPSELLLHIFSYLQLPADQPSLFASSLVCKHWSACVTAILYVGPSFSDTFHWAKFVITITRPPIREGSLLLGRFVKAVDLSGAARKTLLELGGGSVNNSNTTRDNTNHNNNNAVAAVMQHQHQHQQPQQLNGNNTGAGGLANVNNPHHLQLHPTQHAMVQQHIAAWNPNHAAHHLHPPTGQMHFFMNLPAGYPPPPVLGGAVVGGHDDLNHDDDGVAGEPFNAVATAIQQHPQHPPLNQYQPGVVQFQHLQLLQQQQQQQQQHQQHQQQQVPFQQQQNQHYHQYLQHYQQQQQQQQQQLQHLQPQPHPQPQSTNSAQPQSPQITLTTSSLIQLSQHVPHLTRLCLSGTHLAIDTYIKETGEYISSLQQQALQPGLTHILVMVRDAIVALGSGCPSLARFEAVGCDWVTNLVVALCARHLLKLERLDVRRCGKCTVDGLTRAAIEAPGVAAETGEGAMPEGTVKEQVTRALKEATARGVGGIETVLTELEGEGA